MIVKFKKSLPKYDELDLFIVAFAVILFGTIISPGLLQEAFVVSTWETLLNDPSLLFFTIPFWIGLGLSLYHGFVSNPKSKWIKGTMVYFSLGVNVVVAFLIFVLEIIGFFKLTEAPVIIDLVLFFLFFVLALYNMFVAFKILLMSHIDTTKSAKALSSKDVEFKTVFITMAVMIGLAFLLKMLEVPTDVKTTKMIYPFVILVFVPGILKRHLL